MKLTGFRKHLTGEAEFMSYVPTPLTEIHVVHTAELDGLIEEVENSVRQLNAYASQLPYDHIRQLMLYEAENSCMLAFGGQMSNADTTTEEGNALKEDTANLLKATSYAVEAMDGLPLSARLLKNAHYLMCDSDRYEKMYPGEFRTSPVWIGQKGNSLKEATFVPPVYEDMTDSFTDLERYINYECSENVFVRAALIHYQFEMIHPFIDGNGRIGRLLNTLYLMNQDALEYPILQLSAALNKKMLGYYMRIQNVNDTREYEDWVHFYLNALKSAASVRI